MSNQILRTGDKAIYDPAFTPALVTVSPGTLTGSAVQVSSEGATVCVQGDEASATVPSCAYVSGGYTIPGTGTLSIAALGTEQLSKKSRSKGKPLMLRGSTFTAQFQVIVPAQMPTAGGPVPDPVPLYTGSGSFQTKNTRVWNKR